MEQEEGGGGGGSDESTRRTRLPTMWPGFDSQTQRHIWFELLVFFSASEGFLRVLRFSSLLKTWFNLRASWLSVLKLLRSTLFK